MVSLLRVVLLLTVGLASMNAVICGFANMGGDCQVYSVVAVCALGGFFLVDYVEQESRKRLAAHRDDVWARREGRR
ncbi:hypothetical protein PJP13_24370 [Mycobacterium kansasii]